jgi:hypothetical protein
MGKISLGGSIGFESASRFLFSPVVVLPVFPDESLQAG